MSTYFADKEHRHTAADLEANTIGYGRYIDRPGAGFAQRLYFASDTLTMYRDNGSSWQDVGGASAAGSSPYRYIVNATYGNDTAAAANSPSRAFATITAAKNAAVAAGGGTVIVLPKENGAYYNEGNLAASLKYKFEQGAGIKLEGTGIDYGIFDVQHSAYSNVTMEIDGGYFEWAATPTAAGTARCTPLCIDGASSVVHVRNVSEMKCSSLGTAQDHVGFSVYNGKVYFYGCGIASSRDYDGGDVYGGTVWLDWKELYGSYRGAAGTGEGLEITGGTVYGYVGYCHSPSTVEGGDAAILISNNADGNPECDVTFDRIEGTNKAIRLTGSGSGTAATKRCIVRCSRALGQISIESGLTGADIPKLYFDGRYIYSATLTPIVFDASSSGYDLHLYSTEVRSGGGNRPAVTMEDGTQMTLFSGCVFVPNGTPSPDKDIHLGSGNATIRAYGFAGGPKGLATNITATVGSYTTDAQIT